MKSPGERLSTEWRVPAPPAEPWLGPSLRRLGRNPVFLALLAAQVLAMSPYLGLLIGRPPSLKFRDGISFVLLGAVTGIALAVGGWRSRISSERRLHFGVALACLLWALEELLESLVWDGSAGWLAVALDAMFVGFYASLILATDEAAGAGPRAAGLQRLEHLELAAFLVGLLLYFTVVPGRIDPAAYLTAVPSSVLFLGLDLLTLGWFVWGWSRARGPRARFRWTTLVVTALLFTTDDALYLSTLTAGFELSAVGWDFLWFVPFLTLGMALLAGPVESPAGPGELDPLDLPIRQLGINLGWLLAALLPAGHLAIEVWGEMTPGSAAARRWTVLLATIALGGLATVHQRRLSGARHSLVRELDSIRSREAVGTRLEAIGSLAGGVAHDFRHLVERIGRELDQLETLTVDDRSRRDVDALRRAVERASQLTGNLLAVGQRERPNRQRLDLRAWLDGFAAALREPPEDAVEIECDTGDEPLSADVDAGQLERVVGNLVLNAREALVEGGRIELTLRRREQSPAEDRGSAGAPRAPKGVAVLIVRDNGPGIDEATRRRIFEPFFTTKRDAVGHGLGLSTALGLVRAHGGDLLLTSAPGEGAAFEVLLPLTD